MIDVSLAKKLIEIKFGNISHSYVCPSKTTNDNVHMERLYWKNNKEITSFMEFSLNLVKKNVGSESNHHMNSLMGL
jgi:hypothetical protein